MLKYIQQYIQHSIRWRLFITLGAIMFVCQIITVIWLWHESRDQIDALVNLTLSKSEIEAIIKHEEIDAIFVLFFSTFTMMVVTLFLCYKAIKRIIKPLEQLEYDLKQRTAENLTSIETSSQMKELTAITASLNNLFVRLDDTLQQERLFTADVAHELRTPLAGIRLYLELLEKEQHINCRELITRIDRLVRTIEQLLMLSRANQKFIVGQHQRINFKENIETPLFDELLELTQQKYQCLKWVTSPPAIIFYGDITLIQLLIRNLVENAYRYSALHTEIVVSCYQQQQNIIIQVIDQGIGIDEHKSKQLTQAFFRMDRRHEGLGLGLSIANRIAKLHKGELTMINRNDGVKGTLAKFILPYKSE